MMSSTKSEIHYVLHCHERRTEAQPVTCTEDLAKFVRVVFDMYKQTSRYVDCNISHSYRRVAIIMNIFVECAVTLVLYS